MSVKDGRLANNLAASAFVRGRYADALSEFETALSHIDADLTSEAVYLPPGGSSTLLSVALPEELDEVLEMQSPHNAACLYNRILIFVHETKGVSEAMRPVIEFNYGLCLHIAGLLSTCAFKGRELLRNARRTYTKALRSTMANVVQPSCLNVVRLAILTNLGHLYSHHCATREALNCLQLMRRLFLSTSEHRMTLHDRTIFLTNLAHDFYNPILRCAPSA